MATKQTKKAKQTKQTQMRALSKIENWPSLFLGVQEV
jgi:hypothetical protein